MSPGDHDPSALTRRQKVATMVASLLAVMLAALDQTIVATAGPEIQRDLEIDRSLYVWLTTSYLVASTVTVPLWGKLSDLFGRKRTLLAGMGLFLVGSALCALAGSLGTMVAYRVIQGIGSAALFTNAFAVTADMFAPSERGKYQGFIGGVFGIASVVGPLVGGGITDSIGWQWVFLVNLPVGAVAIAVAMAYMPALQRRRSGPIVLDLAGAGALVVAMGPLLLALSLGHGAHEEATVGWRWGSWQILGLFAVSLAGLVGFLVIERRAREPILDLGMFRNRAFALGCAAAFTAGLPFLASIVFLPLFMVQVVGTSATDAGLVTMPLTLGIVAANIASGLLVARIGAYKPVLITTLLISIAAFSLTAATLSVDSTQTQVALGMIVLGIGMGPAIPLYTLAIQSAADLRQMGVATSTAVFFRGVGATVGLAVLGTVHSSSFGRALAASTEPRQAFTDALTLVYMLAAAIAVLALVITVIMPAVPLRKRLPPAPVE